MELRHLRYFVAVAEELHFGRAARHLHIVQPALSKQISTLESELGVRLLQRSRRRVELTEAGRVFLADARAVLAQADLAVSRAAAAARGEAGVLVVGFIPPALNSVLPSALRRYRERYPDVRLVLRESSNRSAVAGVLAERIHISFVRVPFGDCDLESDVVYEEPVVLAVPAGHPLTARREVPLAALRDEELVMIPRAQEPELHDYYAARCADAGFSPRMVHEVSTTLVAVGLVASGVGIAFVPASTAVTTRSGVVYRPLAGEPPLFRLAAVWRRDPGPVLRAFLALRPWQAAGGEATSGGRELDVEHPAAAVGLRGEAALERGGERGEVAHDHAVAAVGAGEAGIAGRGGQVGLGEAALGVGGAARVEPLHRQPGCPVGAVVEDGGDEGRARPLRGPDGRGGDAEVERAVAANRDDR
jgi:DNA-binding transcriptional LysR family regulator